MIRSSQALRSHVSRAASSLIRVCSLTLESEALLKTTVRGVPCPATFVDASTASSILFLALSFKSLIVSLRRPATGAKSIAAATPTPIPAKNRLKLIATFGRDSNSLWTFLAGITASSRRDGRGSLTRHPRCDASAVNWCARCPGLGPAVSVLCSASFCR